MNFRKSPKLLNPIVHVLDTLPDLKELLVLKYSHWYYEGGGRDYEGMEGRTKKVEKIKEAWLMYQDSRTY